MNRTTQNAAINYLKQRFLEYEDRDMWAELYQELRQQSNRQERELQLSVKESRSLHNMFKNRYRDVSAYDHNRIILQERGGSDSYINATAVDVMAAGRKYILTQGPLQGTADDFWLMIWEQNSRAIIMLNRVIEKNTIKCFQYFPQEDKKCQLVLRTFVVDLISENRTPHFIVRQFELRRKKNVSASEKGNDYDQSSDDSDLGTSLPEAEAIETTEEVRKVSHYQFLTWPDFGVPKCTEDFLQFLAAVRQSGCLSLGKFGPPVVHCSAGIGRSGTFVIVDAISVMVRREVDAKSVDVCDLVLELRKSRMGLIQTVQQLRFCWKALVDAFTDQKWTKLLSMTCDEKKEALGQLKRAANQLTSDTHCLSVDDAEMQRKRSATNIDVTRDVKSACVIHDETLFAPFASDATAQSIDKTELDKSNVKRTLQKTCSGTLQPSSFNG